MKIETKFEPEQYVFYIDKFVDETGKEYYSIVVDYIRRIFINSLKEVYYVLNDEQTFVESELYATREEAEQKLEEKNKMENEKYYYLKSKDNKKSLCRVKGNGITRYFACDFPYTPEDKYHSLVKRKRLKDILKDQECLHDYLSGQAEEDWCWFDVYNEKDEKIELE